MNDLLGGSLQGVMINIGAVTDHVRAGRLRGLFVSSAARACTRSVVPSVEGPSTTTSSRSPSYCCARTLSIASSM